MALAQEFQVCPQGNLAIAFYQAVTDKAIFNIHGSIDLPVPETMGQMSLLVNYSHVSRQNTTPLNPDTIDGVMVEPGASIKELALLNASLAWSDSGQTGLDATLFRTNLANKLPGQQLRRLPDHWRLVRRVRRTAHVRHKAALPLRRLSEATSAKAHRSFPAGLSGSL